MSLLKRKKQFEKEPKIYESAILKFKGVDGFDVYNCSVPFEWNGTIYMFGRVEKRNEWACSWTRLFYMTGKDEYSLVPESMTYQLEDPFISFIGNEIILGGTHVRYYKKNIDTFYDYFYIGKDLNNLKYFTTGPEGMKDIRFIEMPDGIGVFSRPRGENVWKKFKRESFVGFVKISDLDSFDANLINDAPMIEGLFEKEEWGGCNQCYMLDSGLIGVIGHHSCKDFDETGLEQLVYTNISFVFNPVKNQVLDYKLLATRSCYPEAPAKMPNLKDCAFTSGIVLRNDGKVDLYSGIGDTSQGRVTIDYPFEGFGKIIR